jgi:hypothetical protein
MTCTQTTLPSLLQFPLQDDIQESSINHINAAYVSQEVIFVPVEQIMHPDKHKLTPITWQILLLLPLPPANLILLLLRLLHSVL